MTTHFTAIFEGGVLRPTHPIDLREGQQVEVVVIQSTQMAAQSPAAVLSAIAALPLEPGGQEFSGRDHDRILYGNARDKS